MITFFLILCSITQMVIDSICVVTADDSRTCAMIKVIFAGTSKGTIIKAIGAGKINGGRIPHVVVEEIKASDIHHAFFITLVFNIISIITVVCLTLLPHFFTYIFR